MHEAVKDNGKRKDYQFKVFLQAVGTNKKKTGRELNGRTDDEMPPVEQLEVQ